MKWSHASQTSILSIDTRRGAMLGSSNNRLAVSLIEAANDRRQHSGASSVTGLPPIVGLWVHEVDEVPLSICHKIKGFVVSEILMDGAVGAGDLVKQFFFHVGHTQSLNLTSPQTLH